ncbi:MAG: SDR family oxidoreductase, partial [Bacteroidota bacterium]
MILVTGGTGLVGSHLLCRLVRNNLKIRALYRSDAKIAAVKSVFSLYADMPEHAFDSIEWFKADINTLPQLQEAFKGITHVYHCAAMVSFDENNYKTMRKVNIEGTANIVNLSIAHRIKKLCYVSSIATLGESHGDTYITEATHWNADVVNNSYAITKYGAEMEVWRGAQEGLPMVMVSPGVILGAGFWNDGSGRLFPLVEKGFKYLSEVIVCFVGVEYLAEAMFLLMNHIVTAKRYLLVS